MHAAASTLLVYGKPVFHQACSEQSRIQRLVEAKKAADSDAASEAREDLRVAAEALRAARAEADRYARKKAAEAGGPAVLGARGL